MKNSKNGLRVIIGLGKTGLSVAKYFKQKNVPFILFDTRINPPNLATFKTNFPDVDCYTGSIDQYLLTQAEEIIVSPGVDATAEVFNEAREKNIPIVGDVELFAREASVPICAITGSNGKSTVTNLVNAMAN
ncbi:MAG: UDP-N-acetylmuramoyl-L-alanine--D-glutamate ligase, partial [Pseudomonadota bacterium]